MPSRLLRFSAAAILLGLPLYAACGDDDDGATDAPTGSTPNLNPSVAGPQAQPSPAQALQSDPVEPQDGVIELSAANVLFEQNYLRVPDGASVIIRLTNSDSIAHNLRIAGIDGQFATEDDAVSNPEQIDPGSVGELTFAPPVLGAYTFQCDFHPTTMGGQILVGDATPAPTPVATPTPTPSETSDASGEAESS